MLAIDLKMWISIKRVGLTGSVVNEEPSVMISEEQLNFLELLAESFAKKKDPPVDVNRKDFSKLDLTGAYITADGKTCREIGCNRGRF